MAGAAWLEGCIIYHTSATSGLGAKLHYLASSALQLGNYVAAVADYTRALEVEPANSFAYYNRGITRDRMGDFMGAVEDFTQAIALDPQNADFYHNRGFSLRKQVCTQVVEVAAVTTSSRDLYTWGTP